MIGMAVGISWKALGVCFVLYFYYVVIATHQWVLRVL